MEVPQKIKNRTATQCNNFTAGYLLKEKKNTNLKKCIPMFIAALFTIAKT